MINENSMGFESDRPTRSMGNNCRFGGGGGLNQSRHVVFVNMFRWFVLL